MLKKNNHHLHEFDDVFYDLMGFINRISRKEIVDLNRASGRVLAADVFAPMNLPAQNLSAMDGYGYSSMDASNMFKVVSKIYAGDSSPHKGVRVGECVRIMTGAPIPKGVNAVIPVENAYIQTRNEVEYLFQPNPFRTHSNRTKSNIKRVGSDISKDSKVLLTGSVIGSKQLAVLASLGLFKIEVFQKPKVVLVLSGDELQSDFNTLQPGRIYDSNSWLLSDLLKQLPVDLIGTHYLKDNLENIKRKLNALSREADLILTVGGASVGDKDYIKQALAKSPKFRSWKLNMKPAKPLSYSQNSNAHTLALPGNPVAAFMSFNLFAKPLIKKMCGVANYQTKSFTSSLLESVEGDNNKIIWMPVKLTDAGLTVINNLSSSHIIPLLQADGYIKIKPGQIYEEGSKVSFWSYS